MICYFLCSKGMLAVQAYSIVPINAIFIRGCQLMVNLICVNDVTVKLAVSNTSGRMTLAVTSGNYGMDRTMQFVLAMKNWLLAMKPINIHSTRKFAFVLFAGPVSHSHYAMCSRVGGQ